MNTATRNRKGTAPPAATAESSSAAAPAWENPLIPNKKLRGLYTAMAELRLLGSYPGSSSLGAIGASASRARNRKSPPLSVPGEEGCRAGTILTLNPGDLTSDPGRGLATAFLRGADLAKLLALSLQHRGPQPLFPGQLPALPDHADRLHLALGAAFALRTGGRASQAPLTLAFCYGADLNPKQWSTLLDTASAHALPLVFVVLPNRGSGSGLASPGRLSLFSSTRGVPGIPVDADDPVAIYRVAQESTLRARAGGGPVLIECIPFRLAGRKTATADPLITMRQFLLHRRIVNEDWLREIEDRFVARLRTGGR